MIVDNDPFLELYFGDKEQHAKVAEALSASIKENSSSLHLVCGGTRLGKSTAIGKIKHALDKNADFELISYTSRKEKLPDDLYRMTQPVLGEARHKQYLIYKNKTKPQYVVMSEPGSHELPPAYAEKEIKSIADYVCTHEDSSHVTWILDAPILDQDAPIFKRKASVINKATKHDKVIAKLQKSYPGIVNVHTLRYDMNAIRESYWSGIQTHGEYFMHSVKDMLGWERSPEWKQVYQAALSGNRAQYDAAFDIVAKRMQRMEQPDRPS